MKNILQSPFFGKTLALIRSGILALGLILCRILEALDDALTGGEL